MFEKESLVSKSSGVDAVIENKADTDVFATTADGSSPHESEGSVVGSVCDKSSLISINACFPNLSKAESSFHQTNSFCIK